jgi:ArsR family transcriptional regulator
VTEISEYLGVSPKAVIDHLRKLEEAGLIESRTDDQRRKYFHISRNLRLEVNVSPYGFGAKSAYPASPNLDMTRRCSHLKLNIQSAEDPRDVRELAQEFDRLEDLENELSLAQRWVHGRMTDVLDRLSDVVGLNSDSRFCAEVLAVVATDGGTVNDISDEIGASPYVVEDVLRGLAERGIVTNQDGRWRLT